MQGGPELAVAVTEILSFWSAFERSVDIFSIDKEFSHCRQKFLVTQLSKRSVAS
jgi:hypothetical protein